MFNNRLLRNIELGLKSLYRHKLRSLLTMLGVVFGVGSVVAMLSVGEGASRQALAQIRKLGSQNIIVRSAKPSDGDNARQTRSRTLDYGLLFEDLGRIETYPGVGTIAPAKMRRDLARLGARSLNVRMVGTTPDWFELVPRDLVAGRVLRKQDIDESAAVCVIAESAARRLLAVNETLGRIITVSGDPYTVVGIVRTESGGTGVQMPDRADDIYLPLNVMRERVGDTRVEYTAGSRIRETVELHEIIVQVTGTEDPQASSSWFSKPRTVDPVDNVEPTARAIRAGLEMFHPRGDFDVSVPLALLRQTRETQRMFSIVLASVAGISLLVGGIGIMNIMLASVVERTREIGVRRAIGAKRHQIITQFVIETTALSVTGGLIGVGVGILIPAAIEHFADMPTVVTTWSVLLALTISAGVGIIFGLYPAYRAAALDPVMALRHE